MYKGMLGPKLKTAILCTTLVFLSGFLMGLGGGDNGEGSRIPLPPTNHTVLVRDIQGRSLEARRFNCEGRVSLRGLHGAGSVSLPFAKLKRIERKAVTTPQNPQMALAKATLKSGATFDLAIARSSKCYGETDLGDYEIFFKDIARLDFR